MPVTKDIIRGVIFEPEHFERAQAARYDEHLRFLVTDDQKNIDGSSLLTVMGFGLGGWQVGELSLDESVEPNAELEYVLKPLQTLQRHNRGVGPRLYNTPHALRGTKEDPADVGAYLVSINSNRLADMRTSTDNSLAGEWRQRVKYAGQLITSKFSGLRTVVDKEHEEQAKRLKVPGRPDAAIYSQTPNSRKLMARRGAELPPVPVAMMVLRNRNIFMRKIGDYEQHR
jgi:hypothetical protein